jgi:hypothetical protein
VQTEVLGGFFENLVPAGEWTSEGLIAALKVRECSYMSVAVCQCRADVGKGRRPMTLRCVVVPTTALRRHVDGNPARAAAGTAPKTLMSRYVRASELQPVRVL